MLKSIAAKLVVLYLVLVFIVMICISFYIHFGVRKNYKENLEQQAEIIFNQIKQNESEIQSIVFSEDHLDLPGNMEEIKKNLEKETSKDREYLEEFIKKNLAYFEGNQKELYILNKEGKIIEGSNPQKKQDYNNSIAVVSARQGRQGNYSTVNYMEFAYPIFLEDTQEVYAIIVIRAFMEGLEKQLKEINDILVMATFLGLILTAFFGAVFSRTLTGPIQILTQKAKLMSEGDFAEKIEIKSDDEIGQLTMNFNHMAEVLSKTLQEISGEKQKVETILHHMTDGVMAFNKNGILLHINPAAKELLKIEKENWNFNEIFQKVNLDVNFSNFLEYNKDKIQQVMVEVGEKFVNIYFAVYGNQRNTVDGLIVVLQDVTEQKKLEDMRKEFVANVSHELRTPLTTIKSYTETLLDGALADVDMAQSFLNVINNESDRMTRLVQDLLELSRIDNQQVKFNFELVNIAMLARQTVQSLELSAEENDQKIQCFIMGDIPNIVADRHRIEQILINILNNAIKYSGSGTTIKILVERYKDNVKIQIIDNGIGIPKSDLPRIFERFYRVDKARSRQLGGTGLGLSIAKEIIESHGGKVMVESEENEGTRVILFLPIDGVQ